MASISHLKITHLRNLVDVDLQPSPRFNVFYGSNASGKTSLLEAIHVLSTAKSFRSAKLNQLINHQEKAFTLFCQSKASNTLVSSRIGIEKKQRGTTSIRIDGIQAKSSSQLALALPVLSIEASSFQLLDGGPSSRRSFLDWLVFHVKHEYLQHWKAYSRALKQRNILLRRGNISRLELSPWDSILVREGAIIELLRKEVLASFSSIIDDDGLLNTKDYSGSLTLEYVSGWGKASVETENLALQSVGAVYLDVLEAHFQRDLQLGYTQFGSHRHDLRINLDGRTAAQVLSRGQKKSLVIALYLAVAHVFYARKGSRPVFLLDDLPSELDVDRLASLCEALSLLASQVFISAVDKQQLENILRKEKNIQCSWFHVKHGTVQQETL